MRRFCPFRLGTKLGFSIAPRFKVVNLLGFRVRSLSKVYQKEPKQGLALGLAHYARIKNPSRVQASGLA